MTTTQQTQHSHSEDLRTTLRGRTKTRVTIARGDGVGPEIMGATLKILRAADAPLEFDEIDIGEKVYQAGHSSGLDPKDWDVIRRNKLLLKAPITTPQGGGVKSLNVTIRKALNLFANVRPSQSYIPFVESRHPDVDLVIVRENEEDLYAGIEHRQTQEVTQVLKLITRPGSERIIRYAFDYARAHGRSKVTCMTKDNIMKLTDGLFHQVFRETAEEYPEIEAEHRIIDIGAARIATNPEQFDVVVAPNLYGDILSDIAACVTGSIGLAGSANIGQDFAMFEAVHGSAPDIAGQDIANPSGLLLAAVHLLIHIGESEVASRINNAWLATLEDGTHTADIFRSGTSRRKVGTNAFADAVIANLGRQPQHLAPVSFRHEPITVAPLKTQTESKKLVGVDVFLDWDRAGRNANELAGEINRILPSNWRLKMITNRGVKVYPDGLPETFCTDHWRCRFHANRDEVLSPGSIVELLSQLDKGGLEAIKTENLYSFDGNRGYSFGQGE